MGENHQRMTIYYYIPEGVPPPEKSSASGGVRVSYRHVDILNSAGISAAILHDNDGFRFDWFENNTKVASTDTVRIKSDDYLVLTEGMGSSAGDILPGLKKVIFNQNGFMTFNNYDLDPANLETPYNNNEVVAVITASEFTTDYICHAFPQVKTRRVRYCVDPDLFRFVPFKNKKRQIAVMPRKAGYDIAQVINILKFRGALQGYDIAVIDGMSMEQSAQILCESMFFFSSCEYEGFGLPPAEAMATGSICVGYHGFGGAEFWKEEFSYPVNQGDVLTFAKKAENLLDMGRENTGSLAIKAEAASNFIRQTYSAENEKNDLLGAWSDIKT